MELINVLQTDILTFLGKYQYLSVSQLQMLTGKSAGYIREMLARLSRGYIKSYRVEVSYKVRAENIYFLTKTGLEFLRTHKNSITIAHMPIANSVVVRDYFHRFHCVTLHILLDRFCLAHDIPINAYDTYYHKTGSTIK